MTPKTARKSPNTDTNCASHRARKSRCRKTPRVSGLVSSAVAMAAEKSSGKVRTSRQYKGDQRTFLRPEILMEGSASHALEALNAISAVFPPDTKPDSTPHSGQWRWPAENKRLCSSPEPENLPAAARGADSSVPVARGPAPQSPAPRPTPAASFPVHSLPPV